MSDSGNYSYSSYGRVIIIVQKGSYEEGSGEGGGLEGTTITPGTVQSFIISSLFKGNYLIVQKGS